VLLTVAQDYSEHAGISSPIMCC